MSIYPRATALTRTLTAFQAGMLILSIITMSFPLSVLAQEIPVEPEVVVETADTADTPGTDTQTEEECDAGFHQEGEECVADEAAPEPIVCSEGTTLDEATQECVPSEPQNLLTEVLGAFSLETNVPESDPPTTDTTNDGICYAVSDEATLISGNPATETYAHPSWVHTLENDHGAEWIWNAQYANQASLPETVTFTKTINVVNASPATLEIAADNGYTVLVNGNPTACDGTSANNFGAVESCAINLNAGANTLTFTVTNDAPAAAPQENPSGLIYKVTASQSECGMPPPPPTCNAETELLGNGSFENPTVTTAENWNVFTTGTLGLDWIATWLAGPSTFGSDTRPLIANAEFQKSGIISGWAASAGSQWTELDADWFGPSNPTSGEPGQVALTQVITTIPGKTYTFSFDFSPRPDQTNAAQNSVEATAGGVVIGTAGPTPGNGTSTAWSSQSFSFVATTTSTIVGVRDAGTPNDSLGALVDNASLRCTPTQPEPEEEVTIVAAKVVCTNESDLPNWGAGGQGPIGATTAADWVAAHPGCHLLDGWEFEVADQNGGDPGGDYVGTTSPYMIFGPTVAGYATTTVSTSGVSEFHLREVLKNNYIPFTFDQQNQTDADNVSAEFYCSNDVLHYDNWDFIRNPVDGATYYCVAFNALKPGQCNPDAQNVILSSDGQTQDQAGIASIVTYLHESWVDAIDALWIWKDATTSPADAANGTTETFTRQFTISGAPLNASLDIAVDNNVEVKVNGTVVATNPEVEFNYSATTTYAIPAALMQSGLNTITFKVTNLDHATANTPTDNPAGLLYKLTTHDNQCAPATDPTTIKVHIYKHLTNGETTTQVPDNSTAPNFPMVATWSDAGFANGSGNYVLGNQHGGAAFRYAADTSPMSLGADYTTSEVTDGSVVVASQQQCAPGKYFLVGYKSGDSLAEAQGAAISATAPVYTNLTNDKYVIVVNQACGEDENPGGDNDLNVFIYKYLWNLGSQTAQPITEEAVVPDFTMVAKYTIAGVGSNENPGDTYPLSDANNYSTQTLDLASGDHYSTNEVTDGSVVIPYEGQCVPNKYRLVGYKVGTTLLAAQAAAITQTVPNFTITNTDQHVIVVNEDCDDVLEGSDTEHTTVVTGNTSAGENQPGWLFNRDPSTQSPYEFNTSTAAIGSGSLYVLPIENDVNGNSDKFIAELFDLTTIDDLDSVSFEFKIGAPDSTVEEQFYMSVYANFGSTTPTNFYDCRYNLVASTGSTAGFTTLTFDPTQAYPVTTRGSSPHTCPAIPAQMDTVGTGNATIRVYAINVGDTSASDMGVSGHLDNVRVVKTVGVNTHTEIYDFEPTTNNGDEDTDDDRDPEDDGDGSRSGGNSRSDNTGEVLGASTDSCSALLQTYMRLGNDNDSADVMDLQSFLNGEMGATLTVSGLFDAATDAVVRSFQEKYWEDVLAPWAAIGLGEANTATGFVFKTTQWKINMINCPSLNLPFPQLP